MITTLRPGILVSLSTRLSGNVRYVRTDLKDETNGTTEVSVWETEKTVQNAAELAAASKARSDASYIIRRVCARTNFGLLCPLDRETELAEAMAAAQARVAQFNAVATVTRVSLFVIRGRVSDNDADAIRTISAECKDLMDSMLRGIQNADPAAIRDAASRALQLGSMLDSVNQERVNAAVAAARSAARRIVAEVEKKSKDAAEILRGIDTGPIANARFAFLDTDETPTAAPAECTPAVDAQRFALDLDAPKPQETAPAAAPSPLFEME